jgi:hypothetical protein
MSPTATYVYCVVKSTRRPPGARAPRGLAGATAPEAVELGRSLWLIVADVPLSEYGPEPLQSALGNMQWVSDAALAHDAVVEHFSSQRSGTTLPMKMFTMFSTRERAIADMHARRDDLEAVAKRIAGCEEWGVRVTRATARVPRAPRGTAAPASGAAFLAARKQARDDAREAAVAAANAAEDAFAALAAIAADASRRDDVPQGASTPPLIDAAFLVPAARRARFQSAARRAAEECSRAGASMSVTGPWPAYNFVQPSRDGQ